VVHEKKIFQDLSRFSLFCPLLGPKRRQPLYLNKSESSSSKHVSCQVWLKLAKWFLRRLFKHFPIYHYVKVSNFLHNGFFLNICLYKRQTLNFMILNPFLWRHSIGKAVNYFSRIHIFANQGLRSRTHTFSLPLVFLTAKSKARA